MPTKYIGEARNANEYFGQNADDDGLKLNKVGHQGHGPRMQNFFSFIYTVGGAIPALFYISIALLYAVVGVVVLIHLVAVQKSLALLLIGVAV